MGIRKGSTSPPPRRITGATWPQLATCRSALAGSQRATTAVISARGPGISRSAWCITTSASPMSPPLRRLARRAPSATALLAVARVEPPQSVRQGDPDPIGVLDHVEPVPRDLVARQHVPSNFPTRDPRDAGREQALLDLGSRRRLLAALRQGKHIRVAVCQGDRCPRLACQLAERLGGPTEGDHHSVGAAAQPQGVDLRIGEGRELLPQI